ncbi:hypothetical protein [Actinocorallia sp. A-T 12471]|uniref:hypothetical protein n=1 Tax=Actinocorallia sp. A-T 12471 TaxID=3089813 RepID=UPI0029CF9FAD|nr:hypothetical protein [Actinocorallia sp. A-T 12471]MDX6739035.1 hypothetical protein [Actinocorallia sp. A-T 12471]
MDKEPGLWPEVDLHAIKAEYEGWVAVLRTWPEPTKPPEEEFLGLGETVEAGDVTYRIVGDPEEEWSADNKAVISRAFALALNGRHAWILRSAARTADPESERRRAILIAEADLLAEGLPGLPPLLAAETAPGSAVVIIEVPSHTTMGGFYAGRGREAEAVRVLGAGLGRLCTGLASLHSRGLAHGDLGLDSIMTDREGRLFLRDTGQAVLGDAEPAEDVQRLAELIHLTVTGRLPVPLVSASVLNPAVTERFARALGRALSPQPEERGSVEDLAMGLCP